MASWRLEGLVSAGGAWDLRYLRRTPIDAKQTRNAGIIRVIRPLGIVHTG